MPLVDRPHNARDLSPIERGRGLDGEGQGLLFKSRRLDAGRRVDKIMPHPTSVPGSLPNRRPACRKAADVRSQRLFCVSVTDIIRNYRTLQGTSGLALFGQTTAGGETSPPTITGPARRTRRGPVNWGLASALTLRSRRRVPAPGAGAWFHAGVPFSQA